MLPCHPFSPLLVLWSWRLGNHLTTSSRRNSQRLCPPTACFVLFLQEEEGRALLGNRLQQAYASPHPHYLEAQRASKGGWGSSTLLLSSMHLNMGVAWTSMASAPVHPGAETPRCPDTGPLSAAVLLAERHLWSFVGH